MPTTALLTDVVPGLPEEGLGRTVCRLFLVQGCPAKRADGEMHCTPPVRLRFWVWSYILYQKGHLFLSPPRLLGNSGDSGGEASSTLETLKKGEKKRNTSSYSNNTCASPLTVLPLSESHSCLKASQPRLLHISQPQAHSCAKFRKP